MFLGDGGEKLGSVSAGGVHQRQDNSLGTQQEGSQSLRGLAKGRVDARLRNKRPCIIFGDAYPSWIAFAPQLGYEPVLVILRSEKFLSAVEASVPETCSVWCIPDWSALIGRVPHFVGRDAIGLIDGKVTQQTLDLMEVMDIHVALGTDVSRRRVRGWKQVVRRVEHSQEGGVTHSVAHVVACSLQSANSRIPSPSMPTHIPRDLGSVLSDVVGKGVPRPPPRQCRLRTGSIVNVRPRGVRPVYHGMGWLPPKPPPKTLVLTPSVFAPKNRWFLRPISAMEYLAIYDCPERLVSVLSPLVSDPLFPGLHPGKALLAGACSALADLATVVVGNVGGGGGSFLSKRSLDDLTGPVVNISASIKRSRALANEDEPPVAPVFAELSHRQLTPEQDQLLQQVDQDKRERKATKADDAVVPVFMWTKHYIEESNMAWDFSDMPQIERAMNVMRKYLLRRWKRRIFHSYLEWFYDEGKRPRGTTGAEWLGMDSHGRYQLSLIHI